MPLVQYDIAPEQVAIEFTDEEWTCYEAVLPTPFVAEGGVKYWIVIEAKEGPSLLWVIAESRTQKLATAKYGSSLDRVDFWAGDTGDDIAFSLGGFFHNTVECGNGILEGLEQCDGTDDAACPGQCTGFCTCPYVPCELSCPPGADTEQEPCNDSGYGHLNDGCDLWDPAFEPITCGHTVCGTLWATDHDYDPYIDTDWYEIVITEDTAFTLSVEAELPVVLGLIRYYEGHEGSGNCEDIPNDYYMDYSGRLAVLEAVPACTAHTLEIGCLPPGTWWFYVSPSSPYDEWHPCCSGWNDYLLTLDCEPCAVTTCPDDSLFAQAARGEHEYWYTTASDEAVGLTWYEDFSDVYGDVCDLHFWGLIHNNITNEDCLEDPMPFEIRFFQPDGVTSIAPTYNLDLSPVNTYQVYDPNLSITGDEMTLYAFSTDLDPCVPLFTGDPVGENQTKSGWVSIRALGTDDCVFMWAAHDMCELHAHSVVWDASTEEFYNESVDWSLCLTGEQGYPVLGACCYEPTADCNPDELNHCLSTGAGDRFEAYVDCEDLDPPCGVIEGTCCRSGYRRLHLHDGGRVSYGRGPLHGARHLQSEHLSAAYSMRGRRYHLQSKPLRGGRDGLSVVPQRERGVLHSGRRAPHRDDDCCGPALVHAGARVLPLDRLRRLRTTVRRRRHAGGGDCRVDRRGDRTRELQRRDLAGLAFLAAVGGVGRLALLHGV